VTTTSSRQPAGAGNPRVSVAWMIHAYRKPEFVVRLVERLYQPGDSVWIHYDRKAPPGDVVRISRELSRFPQCHIFREVRVSWGGIESVASDLLLCDRLLESEIDFDFVVHLTGSTYPIKNPQRLRFFLADNRARSFLRTSPRPALIEQRPTVEALHLEADEGVEEEHGLARRYLFARGHFGTDRNRPYAARRNIPDLFTLIRRARFDFHLNILRVRKRSAMLQGRPRDVFLPRTFHQIFRGLRTRHDLPGTLSGGASVSTAALVRSRTEIRQRSGRGVLPHHAAKPRSGARAHQRPLPLHVVEDARWNESG